MAKGSVRTSLINVLGTLGYISIIFQWLWTIVTVGHPLLSSDLVYLFPANDVPAVPVNSDPPSSFAIVLVIVLTVIIFAFTFYVLWKLPGAIGKQGGKATRRAATALVPIIARHQKPAHKERRRLSRKLVLIIKGLLVILPCITLVLAQPVGELRMEIIWVVGLFCAISSLSYFGLQQLFVLLWKVPAEDAW